LNRKYLTVSALTKYIKHKIDQDRHLRRIYVKGELSNVYLHRMSGHMYFTLKDEHSQIKAVMYRDDNSRLSFKVEDGMKVFAAGYISVYIKNGEYQLYVQKMEPSGIGALHLAFEQLKKKLQKGNYFSKEHKKTIPQFPKKIAIITSRDGAVVRDIITTVDNRFPLVELIIFPVNVQGEQAVPSIVQAIERANKGDFDTLIVARGGGSLEDLQSFNDERVAMAIFHSRIPVITGIGHETDTTISDLVSDLRAPTPTGAAQFAVPSLKELIRQVDAIEKEIVRLSRYHLLQKERQLKLLEQSRAFTYPLQLVRDQGQRVDQLTDRLFYVMKEQLYEKRTKQKELERKLQTFHPAQALSFSRQKVTTLQGELQNKLRYHLQKKEHHLALLVEKLSLLNPLEIMKRGYSITYGPKNSIVSSISQIEKDDLLTVQLYDGEAICTVKEVVSDEQKQ